MDRVQPDQYGWTDLSSSPFVSFHISGEIILDGRFTLKELRELVQELGERIGAA